MENDSLHKKFFSGGVVITRDDYESMLCPMYAREFTDEQMQELTNKTANILASQYGYNEYEISRLKEDTQEMEDYYHTFLREKEKCAIVMGMRYYDDISDKEYKKIRKKLHNSK